MLSLNVRKCLSYKSDFSARHTTHQETWQNVSNWSSQTRSADKPTDCRCNRRLISNRREKCRWNLHEIPQATCSSHDRSNMWHLSTWQTTRERHRNWQWKSNQRNENWFSNRLKTSSCFTAKRRHIQTRYPLPVSELIQSSYDPRHWELLTEPPLINATGNYSTVLKNGHSPVFKLCISSAMQCTTIANKRKKTQE